MLNTEPLLKRPRERSMARKAVAEYFSYVFKECGDMAAARNMLEAFVPNSSFKLMPEVLEHVCAGFGAVPLVGTPEQVVEGFRDLVAAGIDGAAISWIDYAAGMAQYSETLLPLLRDLRLRACGLLPVRWTPP